MSEADPYRELRELAAAILSLCAKTPEIQAGWEAALARQSPTILDLIDERNRLLERLAVLETRR